MKLYQLATEYITLKQSMGMRFRAESVILKAFCRAMGEIDINPGHSKLRTEISHRNGAYHNVLASKVRRT